MSKRIYLRALELEDYKVSIKWRQDNSIWKMLGGTKYFVSSEYEKKWVADAVFNSKDIKLAVCLISTGEYIGNVYLTDINMIHRTASSHILIGNKNYWGKGYASEALKELLEFGFYERGLRRVQALVLEENIASIKMFTKCGYVREGLLRESVFKDGEFKNQVLMSILAKDFSLNVE